MGDDFKSTVNKASKYAIGRYGRTIAISNSSGNSMQFTALRRPSTQIDLGGNTASVCTWLITAESFALIKEFLGGTDPFFNAEKITDSTGIYRLDRRTPYEDYDGTGTIIRLVTLKVQE